MISDADISAFLSVVESRGKSRWTWNLVEDKRYWRVKYTGTTPPCEIHVELAGPSLCLQVDLVHTRVNPECRAALNLFLLCLNEDLPVVKFGVRDRGRVSLMAEMLATHVDFRAFEELLQGLVAVFAQYGHEIELLAADSTLAGILMKGLDRAVDSDVRVTVGQREQVTERT